MAERSNASILIVLREKSYAKDRQKILRSSRVEEAWDFLGDHFAHGRMCDGDVKAHNIALASNGPQGSHPAEDFGVRDRHGHSPRQTPEMGVPGGQPYRR